MAEQQWEISYRSLPADEDVPVLSPIPPRLFARIMKDLPYDSGAIDQPSFQVMVTLRPIPDPAEAERVAAARRELNRLSAEAGQRIQRQLRDEGQIP